MNYEEKYNEALERAKKFEEKYGGDYAGYIFPELAESEDERIRKWLVEYVKRESGFTDNFPSQGQVLAWLEKQKEQKPELYDMGRWDEESYNNGIHHVLQNPSAYGLTKEQKPAEWSEEDIKKIRSEEYTKGFNDAAFGGKLKEWSEEDEDRIRQIERIAQAAGCTQKLQEEIHDWLKSIRRQVKAEWSEEDEKMLSDLRNTLGCLMNAGAITFKTKKKFSSWLKSLRPSWKPSDEQMKALLNAEGFLRAGLQHDSAKTIAELYEHLKKL